MCKCYTLLLFIFISWSANFVPVYSSSSETLIFMFLGVRVVSWPHVWNTSFVFVTLIFILLFRALGELFVLVRQTHGDLRVSALVSRSNTLSLGKTHGQCIVFLSWNWYQKPIRATWHLKWSWGNMVSDSVKSDPGGYEVLLVASSKKIWYRPQLCGPGWIQYDVTVHCPYFMGHL